MKGVCRRPSPALIVSIMALVLAMGGFAVAAIPDGSGVIHGCYKKKKGTLRLVSGTKCKKSEKSISWNEKGQPGTAGAQGAQGGKGDKGDAGTPATVLWAVVNAAGTLSRGSSHVVSTTKNTDPGRYTVKFDTDVSGCAYTASRGAPSPTTPPSYPTPGEATVAPLGTDATAVYVAVADSSGALANAPFYVAAFC
jgi:hypothetical protein